MEMEIYQYIYIDRKIVNNILLNVCLTTQSKNNGNNNYNDNNNNKVQ